MAKDGLKKVATVQEAKERLVELNASATQDFYDKFFDIAEKDLQAVEVILDYGTDFFKWRLKALTVFSLWKQHKDRLINDPTSKVHALIERIDLFKVSLQKECDELGITVEEVPNNHALKQVIDQANQKLTDAFNRGLESFAEGVGIPLELYDVLVKYEQDCRKSKVAPPVPDWQKLIPSAK